MRPTDFCHPIELRAPAPRVFPIRAATFVGGEAPWRVRLHAALSGDQTFHDVRRPLRRVVTQRESLVLYCLTAWRYVFVGVFFPRRRCDRASDTPVATLDFPVDSPSRVGLERRRIAETTVVIVS
jgi:hypothetical protein